MDSCSTVQVSEVLVGDELMWSYGETSIVVDIQSITARSVKLTDRSANGRFSTHQMSLTTLVKRVI
jgi:hypothetical protein